jgi:streptomycin 6-kinase
VSWLGNHSDEFVLVFMSHFDGDGAEQAADDVINSMGLERVSDCGLLQSMTVGDARNSSCLPGTFI